MDDAQRTRDDLLRELWELRRWKDTYESTLPKRREDRIRIRLIESAPLTIWACDRECNIVCWNRQAEVVYGYTAEEAIGRNFLELFVDELERDQAEEDCHMIIDTGKEFRNFIAYDVAKDGSQRRMLTNCFRVWDDEASAFLQAEVGLDISDLPARQEHHRTLRELGATLVAERRQTLEIKRAEMSNLLEGTRCSVEGVLIKKMRELEDWVQDIKRSGATKKPISATEATRKRLNKDIQYVAHTCASLKDTIKKATDMDQLEELRVHIQAVAKVAEKE